MTLIVFGLIAALFMNVSLIMNANFVLEIASICLTQEQFLITWNSDGLFDAGAVLLSRVEQIETLRLLGNIALLFNFAVPLHSLSS